MPTNSTRPTRNAASRKSVRIASKRTARATVPKKRPASTVSTCTTATRKRSRAASSRATVPTRSRASKASKVSRRATKATVVTSRFEWECLPAVPFDIVLSYLRTDDSNEDLCNLRKVSRHLKRTVDEFVSRRVNRPRFSQVRIEKTLGTMKLKALIHPSNLALHQLADFDWSRFSRGSVTEDGCRLYSLEAPIRSVRDPVIGQLHRLLGSACLKEVRARGLRRAREYDLVERILEGSRISYLYFVETTLNDAIGERILSIVASTRATTSIVSTARAELADPASFVEALDSLCSHGVRLRETGPSSHELFGLSADYWEALVVKKLRSGARVWVDDFKIASTTNPIYVDLDIIDWSN